MNTSNDKNQRHKQRMQHQKKVVDDKISQATIDQGVIVLLTGNGKGKSSSAFGMLVRSLGHGQKCAVVQFIKGQIECGENLFFTQYKFSQHESSNQVSTYQQGSVDFLLMSTGFTWETQNFEADKIAAENIWLEAQEFLKNSAYDMVIFDEITYMFKFNYLNEDEFIETLQQRPKQQSVILTGRGASKKLINTADTVTELILNKHAFNQGIKARKGIEW